MGVIEYSHKAHREKSFKSEVRASGRFSAEEVRTILQKTEMRDLRQIGCPDWLFNKLLESRAKKLGLTPAADSNLAAQIEAAKPY